MAVIEQIISEPQMAILQSVADLNLFLAGTGSGKTFLGGALSQRFVTEFPEVRGGIFANTYDQLNTSTLFRIREYWDGNGITEWSKENPSGLYVSGKEPPLHWTKCKRNFDRFNNIISFCNGGLIFTGSLDNVFSHSGKEFGWALLDETKDSKEEGIKEVIITRMRQPGMYIVDGKISHTGKPDQQWNPLYCLTSPARVDWLNEMFELEKFIDEISAKIYSDKTFFFKHFGNKCAVISSTYHNVHNVGINYINNILNTNSAERGKALVYGNPFAVTGGEFYSSFDRLKHVKVFKYDPSIPLHLSFDQNSVPYNSCGISQVVNVNGNWECRFIDEIALENPRNSTEEVCEEFMMRYPDHKAGLFYYGDASGHNRTTMNKDFKHHYEVIEFKLRKYLNNNSDRTLISNPSVPGRRDFMNLIFEDKLPIRIYFDESCKKMIADMMYTKQALDGGKDKHIVTDKDTGDKYQKYGHFGDLCFIGSTLITTIEGKKRIDCLGVNDLVLTRNGFHRVTHIICKGIHPVNTFAIGSKEITCTPDHKIYNNGIFSMVSTLINKNIIAIFEEKQTWKDKLLFMMGLNFIDTQMQKKHLTETTIKDGSKKTGHGAKKAFTFINTQKKSGLFLKVFQYTILILILIIMKYQIMRLCLVENILVIITKYQPRNTKTPILKNLLNWLFPKRLNGTNLKQERNGMSKTLLNLYIQKSILQNVLIVARNSNLTLEGNRNIAQEDVNLNTKQENIEQQKNITKKEYVKDVVKHFQLINGVKTNSVLVNVRKVSNSNELVYDITVDSEHEYFANGILVHNCEYQCVELFKNFYNG